MVDQSESFGAAFWGDADDAEARERYRTLLETVGDGIYRLDAEDQFVAVNDAIVEMTGYDRDDLLGEHVSVLFDCDGSTIERLRPDAAGRGELLTVPVETASGTRRVWELRVNAIVEEGTVGIARDVTGNRQRDSDFGSGSDSDPEPVEQRYRTLVEQFPNGSVGLFDEDLRYTAVGGQLFDRLDFDPQDGIGDSIHDLYSPELVEKIEPHFRAALDGETNSFEVAFRDLHLSATTLPVRNDEGEVTSGMVVVQDITERRERERELERYEALIESVNEGVYVVDRDRNFTWVNEAYAEMLGYSRDELVGENATVVFDDVVIRGAEMLEREQGYGTLPRMEVELLTSSGERLPVEVESVLLPGGEESDWFRAGVVRDITGRKERERALEESERRYRTLVENFPNGAVGLFDEDLQYIAIGGELLEQIDLSPEDRIGERVTEVYPDGIVEEYESYFHAAIEGEANSMEAKLHDRHLHVRILPVGDGDDDVIAGMVVAQDITDQVERQRELEQYETLVETVPDGAYVLDENHRYQFVNEAFTDLSGYSREELLGSHVSLVASEDVEAKSNELREELLEGERDFATLRSKLHTADGDTIPLESYFTTLPYEEKFRGTVGVARDISERIERERALDESERRYRTLVENFPNGAVVLFDEDLRYLTVGGELFEDVEISTDELEGDRITEHVPEELRDTIVPRFRAVFDGERSEFEAEFEGEIRRFRAFPIRDEEGTVFAGMAMSQDVTQRRERERELRQQRERLTALNNLHRVALEINRALARQTSREEIESVVCERLAESDSYEFAWVGTVDGGEVVPSTAVNDSGYLDDVTVSTDDSRDGQGPTGRAVRTGELQVVQNAADAPEYERWREQVDERGFGASAAVPVAYEGHRYGVLNVYTSRTDAFDREEKEVVRQLGEITGLAIAAAEREQQLEHERERFELLTRLVRHNLLNSLNVIEARLELLSGRVDHEVAEHLETARDRTAEMSHLVETVRELMRAIGDESHDLEPIDLGSVLEDEIEQARRAFDRAEFEIRGDLTGLGPVMADELLEEVIENLLTNAVQHNDEDTPRVRVAVESDADTATFHVADNGPGVPEELEDSLFQKGERAFESPGSGFGLYLVREIVDAYGGTITIGDTDSGGAVFSVTLPRAPGDGSVDR